MSNLVERYIHQVGRYVSGKERADIEAELRSQIQDQLEDRYGDAPTEAEVAAVLAELGEPRRMAASYGGEQYLVGPDLYPVMMLVLRRGWAIVPPVAVLVRVLSALLGDDSGNLIDLLLESAAGAFQATFIFTGIVVLIFAIVQHSGEDLEEITGSEGFDPLALPEVDVPGEVDRVEAVFGIAFGAFALMVMLYYLRVGGLTLRFNLADPGAVTPVPIPWLVALIAIVATQVGLQLVALLRGRWTIPTHLLSMALDIIGGVALYFVLWLPLADGLFAAVPALAGVPLINRAPELLLVGMLLLGSIENFNKLGKMLGRGRDRATTYPVKGN